MSATQPGRVWNPARFAIGTYDRLASSGIATHFTVIILNQPLENSELLIRICSEASYVVCADGGANRLRDLDLEGSRKIICTPTAICGDLDSIRPDVEERYREEGVKILKDPDQYSTDLTKCLNYVNRQYGQRRRESLDECPMLPDIAIVGGLGGRPDQAFSQLHHLYDLDQHALTYLGNLYLVTKDGIMILLEKGWNKVHTPVDAGHFTENVGIIPIGRPSIISTHGLEWDVTDWATEFGTQISTSNHIKAEYVEITTSERVLFTLEFATKNEVLIPKN